MLQDSLSLLLSTTNAQLNININNYEDLINQNISESEKDQNEVFIRVWNEELIRIKDTLENLNKKKDQD